MIIRSDHRKENENQQVEQKVEQANVKKYYENCFWKIPCSEFDFNEEI